MYNEYSSLIMNIIKTNLSQKEPAMNAETVYRVDNAETVKI